MIFGGGMAADKPVEILRFANRVPLMYQQGGCLLTKAIESVDWRQYGLDQAGGCRRVPKGPAAILVHLASTNVQFTSEAKEALADNGEVLDEVRKAMLEMGRGLRKHLEKKKKMAKDTEKFELVNDIIPAIAEKSAAILGKPVPDLAGSITKIMGAVISESATTWNKETKQTDVSITLFNYTSRARATPSSPHGQKRKVRAWKTTPTVDGKPQRVFGRMKLKHWNPVKRSPLPIP